MSYVPSILLAATILSSVGNLSYAGKGGWKKSPGGCACDAVFEAFIAAWLYWGSGLF